MVLNGLEWWPSFVGLDRAEPPGPGKPLTIIDTGVDLTHEEFASATGDDCPERAVHVRP